MKSSISDMRDRITILAPAKINDNLGGYTVSWASKWTLWAHIIALRKTNLPPENKGWAKSLYFIRVRSGINLKPTMRVKWRGKILKIISEPVLDNLDQKIEFSVIEITKGGIDCD